MTGLLRAIHNRRETNYLGQMSEVELADIGLRRGDLFEVSESPLKTDPTGRLSAIAASRLDDKAIGRHG